MASRATSTWSVLIDRPPAGVFEYLSDVRRHAEWSPRPYRVEGLADGPLHQGSTFVSFGWVPRDPDHRNDVEVTEYEPPTTLTLVSREKDQSFINKFVLTPEGGGTRVERSMDMPRPAGLLGVLFPLLVRGLIRPTVQKGMNMFKTNLGRGTGSPGAS